jgi:hypothetical protein
MNIVFKKINTNFKISFDLDTVLSKFVNDVIDPGGTVYSDPTGAPHFQQYMSGVGITRNFYKNFPRECATIAIQLKKIQQLVSASPVPVDDLLTHAFVNHVIKPGNINLIRIKAGENAAPHSDTNRKICINIGLRNSNSCVTHITENESIEDFWNKLRHSFIMEDGDIYILNIRNSHAVESLVDKDSGITRYIITYNLQL